MAKIERKYMAHFINNTPKGPAEYERIGADLEEYSPEMSAQVDKTKNILGEVSTKISSYEVTGSVEPYYADKESKLGQFLQRIVDERLVLDDCKTDIVEVKLWEEAAPASTYPAYKETCFLEVVSYGGDTTGYQIPFTVHYMGDRVKGTFNASTKTFSPAGA